MLLQVLQYYISLLLLATHESPFALGLTDPGCYL